MSKCNHYEMGNDGTMLSYAEGDCPYCEIDRLKAGLEEAKEEAFKREARIMMYVQQVCGLERQLASARAEVARKEV